MGRERIVFLLVVAANLLLVLAFPPYDYHSVFPPRAPTFDGFHPFLATMPNRSVNVDFYALEIIVVLVNGGIGWLLLGVRKALPSKRANRAQRILLCLVGLNLVAMLLYPPFENSATVSQATLPSFDGFYFIFLDNSKRQLVSAILWIEASLVLANGLLFWLLLRNRTPSRLSADDVRAMAKQLKAKRQAGP